MTFLRSSPNKNNRKAMVILVSSAKKILFSQNSQQQHSKGIVEDRERYFLHTRGPRYSIHDLVLVW
jgi:hypothetical protein